jgi:hypothetical protein
MDGQGYADREGYASPYLEGPSANMVYPVDRLAEMVARAETLRDREVSTSQVLELEIAMPEVFTFDFATNICERTVQHVLQTAIPLPSREPRDLVNAWYDVRDAWDCYLGGDRQQLDSLASTVLPAFRDLAARSEHMRDSVLELDNALAQFNDGAITLPNLFRMG